MQKQGRHPIVYSAAGSHATFYSSAVWLGTGQNGSGVGCDNTAAPLTAYHPRAVLLPDTIPRTGRFAWLDYDGHWGQREAGFNDGPQGPNTKKVWQTPFSWMDATRTRSPEVPGESLMGPTVSQSFCGAVATVSRFINLKAQTSAGAIAIVLAIVVALTLPLVLTRWRPVQLEPLRTVRAGGQIILAAGRLFGRHLVSLVLIALVALFAVTFLEALEWLIRHLLSATSSNVSVTDTRARAGPSAALTIGRLIATPFATAIVIAFIRNLERGQDTRLPATAMAVLRRLWRLVAVQLLIIVCLLLMAVTIIGIPIAIVKFIDWQFAQQEILFEDRGIRDAMRGSTRLVRRHRWHTGTVAGALWVLSQAPPSSSARCSSSRASPPATSTCSGDPLRAADRLRQLRSHAALPRPRLPPRARSRARAPRAPVAQKATHGPAPAGSVAVERVASPGPMASGRSRQRRGLGSRPRRDSPNRAGRTRVGDRAPLWPPPVANPPFRRPGLAIRSR